MNFQELREELETQIEESISRLYEEAHSLMQTKTGDETIEQAVKLDTLQKELLNLIIEQVTDNIDFFERYDLLPENVAKIIERFSTMEADYQACGQLKRDLNRVGYTCEYGLDAVPYYLHELDNEGIVKMFTVVRFDQWGNVANTYTEELAGIMDVHYTEVLTTMNVGDKVEGTDYHIIRIN